MRPVDDGLHDPVALCIALAHADRAIAQLPNAFERRRVQRVVELLALHFERPLPRAVLLAVESQIESRPQMHARGAGHFDLDGMRAALQHVEVHAPSEQAPRAVVEPQLRPHARHLLLPAVRMVAIARGIEYAALLRHVVEVVRDPLSARSHQHERAPDEHELAFAEFHVAEIRRRAHVRIVGTHVEANTPAVVAILGPLFGDDLDPLTHDLDPAARHSDLVVADDIGADAEPVALALLVPIFEERRHPRAEGHIVGDRLDLVASERVANLLERLDDLVSERPDAGESRVVAQLAIRADGPLLAAARYGGPAIHDAAVVVAAESEVDRELPVLAHHRRPDLLGPTEIRGPRRAERSDDLGIDQLVNSDDLADVVHFVASVDPNEVLLIRL